MRTALLLALTLCLAGCHGLNLFDPIKDAPAPAKASEAAKANISDLERAQTNVHEAEKTVGDMTPQNLPVEKPKAQEQLHEADKNIAAAGKSANATLKLSLKDEKKIEELSQDDPLRTKIRWIALALFVLAVGLLAMHQVEYGLIALFAAGLFAAVAQYLRTIEHVCGGLVIGALVILAIWLAVRYVRARGGIKSIVQSIEVGKQAGVVTFAPGAKAVLDHIQGDAKALVDKFQKV